MRHELVIAEAKRHAGASLWDDFLLLTALCLSGVVLSIYLLSSYEAFKDLPLLIVQYNLG